MATQHANVQATASSVPGLVKVVDRADVAAADWSLLTPGLYVGVAPQEEDEGFDFEQTLRDIHTELGDLNKEAAELATLKALECRDGIDSLFLFHSLLDQRAAIRELATEASHRTKKLDTPVLGRLPILVAELRLQRLFRNTVASSLALRDNLYHQNARLRAARDLLLPRLMSGETAV
jgi:hypothetical protein